jgi:hypothetical protein
LTRASLHHLPTSNAGAVNMSLPRDYRYWFADAPPHTTYRGAAGADGELCDDDSTVTTSEGSASALALRMAFTSRNLIRDLVGKAMPRMIRPRGARTVTLEGVPFEVRAAWAALGWPSEKIMGTSSEEKWKMTLVGKSLSWRCAAGWRWCSRGVGMGI